MAAAGASASDADPMADTVVAYIGLGSNLNDPKAQIKQAFKALKSLPDSRLGKCSPLYRSVPMGPQDQPQFINAVAQLYTRLPPLLLLENLQRLELAQGRHRGRHWGPRSLDLDILLYNNLILNSEQLTIPHSGLYLRNFVLYPLADIAPTLIFPDGSKLADHVKNCASSGLKKL